MRYEMRNEERRERLREIEREKGKLCGVLKTYMNFIKKIGILHPLLQSANI